MQKIQMFSSPLLLTKTISKWFFGPRHMNSTKPGEEAFTTLHGEKQILKKPKEPFFFCNIAKKSPTFVKNQIPDINFSLDRKMEVEYYLEPASQDLYCRITQGARQESFSLGYQVPAGHWDAQRKELTLDDNYFTALYNLHKYLLQRYKDLQETLLPKADILHALKEEIETIIRQGGIEKLLACLFDKEYVAHGIPPFEEFVRAFEKYSSLPHDKFHATPVGSGVLFETEDESYEMQTFEGISHEVEEAINCKNYNALAEDTYPPAWDEVYYDSGISKHDFIPAMLIEWEIFWQDRKRSTKANEKILKEKMEESWRQFQVFMECYREDESPIELAEMLSHEILYPLSIIAMLRIFDLKVSIGEYCSEFFNEWTAITLHENETNENEAEEGNDKEKIFWITPV